MLSDKSKLAEQFELEIWLYLDNELDDDRMKYWDDKIAKSEELRIILNETKETLNIYSAESLHDIDNPTFKDMLDKATDRRISFKSIFRRLFGFDSTEEERGLGKTKIAFGSMLAIAGLVMFLVSEKPNPVKNISSDLLDWEPETISEQLDEIDGGLTLMENNKLKQYLLYKNTQDDWSKDVLLIEKQIEDLMERTEEKSL